MAEGVEVVGGMYHRHYHEKDRGCNDYGRRDDKWIEQNIADGVSALREAVPEVKNAIADKINAAMAQDNANARSMEHMICATERNLAEGQREVQRDVVENRSVIKDSQCSIESKVMGVESKLIERLDYETDIIKLQLNGFERLAEKNFCEVKESIKDSERRIQDKLCDMENERKNDLISELRATSRNRDIELAIEKSNVAFSNQLQMLNSQLIDLSQAQRATNSTIQFGAGNLAGQAATANQVR